MFHTTVDEVLDAVKVAPGEDLLRDVMVGVAEQSAHMALWLAKVAEIDRRELWGHVEGARSCAQWLGWKCGLDGRTAREHVRVAHRLEELPAVQRAFAEGRLSYSKVRALCRAPVATPEAEEFLLDLALNVSAGHLERILASYARAHGEPLTLEDEVTRRISCGVTRWVDDEGLIHHEIVSPPEEGLLIDRAMAFGREELYRETKAAAAGGEGSGGIERPRRPSGPAGRLEGLVWALRNGLANAARGVVVDDPYLVVLHVKEGQAFVADDGRVDLGNGLAVHPRVLQRLACSSMIQAMLVGEDGEDGERPLDLGRRRRTATRDQKIALRALHATCAWPTGCGVPAQDCQFHHLEYWGRDLGRSDLDNYRPLCAFHHKRVHEGGWALVVGPEGRLVAMSPEGRRQGAASPMVRMQIDPEALVRRIRRHGVEPDGQELGGAYAGERMTTWALGVLVEGVGDTLGWGGGDDELVRGSPPSLN